MGVKGEYARMSEWESPCLPSRILWLMGLQPLGQLTYLKTNIFAGEREREGGGWGGEEEGGGGGKEGCRNSC